MTPTRKRARLLIATGISTMVLALGLCLPAIVGASDLAGTDIDVDFELERECATGGLLNQSQSAQCSFNIAKTESKQFAPQDAYVKNDVDALQFLKLEQENEAYVKPEAENKNYQKDLTSVAKVETKSGDANAYGHWQVVDLKGVEQKADADAKGIVVQTGVSGSADTKAYGDIDASGGYAGAKQESKSVIAGDGWLKIEGEIGVTKGGDAVALGKAGDGGDVEKNEAESGKGGSNLAIPVSLGGFAIAADDNKDDKKDDKKDENNTYGAGGTATGGGSSATSGTQTAGSSGQASLNGTAGDGGNLFAIAKTESCGDTNVNALAKGVGDNASSEASGTATGGSANGGWAGQKVEGGKSGDVYNKAAIVGGQATNILNVDAKQYGDVYAKSGDVSNTGSATSGLNANVEQKSYAKTEKVDQSNDAKGGNGVGAKAESEQKGASQTVTSTNTQTAKGISKTEGLPFDNQPR